MTSSVSKQTNPEPHAVPIAAEAGLSAAPAEPIDPAQRHSMIAEAAFFIAQTRSFTPSQELDDWLAAEREIEQRLSTPPH